MTSAAESRSFSRESGDISQATDVIECLSHVVNDLMSHAGHGQCEVRMRWVGKGLKEVCIAAGKEYRFVVKVAPSAPPDDRGSRLPTGKIAKS
jgi:hypothetical protein